jgi:hypothetical protein
MRLKPAWRVLSTRIFFNKFFLQPLTLLPEIFAIAVDYNIIVKNRKHLIFQRPYEKSIKSIISNTKFL